MSQIPVESALQTALAHRQAGRMAAAEEICRDILGEHPEHPGARLLLASISVLQLGRNEAATEFLRCVLKFHPDLTEAHFNLGVALQALGQINAAIESFAKAAAMSDWADAHYNQGALLQSTGHLDEAMACFRRALVRTPAHFQAHNNLGVIFQTRGQLDEAAACYRQALQIKPDHPGVLNNLGIVLSGSGQIDAAIASFRRAIEVNPRFVEAHFNLGAALQSLGRYPEAIACQRRAVQLAPDYLSAWNSLGTELRAVGELDDAAASFRHGLEIKPDTASIHNNLANVLKDQGRIDEALAECRQAMALDPTNSLYHGNLLYTLHFHSASDARALFEQHTLWNAQHAEPLAHDLPPHDNDPAPERPLKIGYVSPDFSLHPVGRFLRPLLAAHDRRQFAITCYATSWRSDDFTPKLRQHADTWRPVANLRDDQLAELVRADQIDILVDLTMHMAGTRILLFARKPAPVQVTYLAYCSTTGLRAMDYRLTDPLLDPPGDDNARYAEESVRLPRTYWCYEPALDLPPANDLPALSNGYITFGCLNNFCKVTADTLQVWCELLRQVPDSRLLLHCPLGSHRQDTLRTFSNHGISTDRIELVGKASLPEYYHLYQRIDIALDPFPYGGGTTTCDALWMGVAVVSLAGQTAVGRGGLSILTNIGLPELVGRTPEEYLGVATSLARDIPRLKALRAALRSRLQNSPLMDSPQFARDIEAAYRFMWRRWCAKQPPRR